MFVSNKRFDELVKKLNDEKVLSVKYDWWGLTPGHNNRIDALEKNIFALMDYLGVEKITTKSETKIVKKSKKKKQLYPILAKDA